MRSTPQSFFEYAGTPVQRWTRPILVLLLVPLALSFFFPLWQISMKAPQYPRGLYMDIYSYKLEGGDEGQHIQEINILNHYIGMAPIDRDALRDLDWIPFAFGVLGLLTLRVAAIGSVRNLIDVTVLIAYVSAVAFGRFVYMLYTYGHNLDPRAPMTVEPFMPPVLGTKQIANMTSASTPQLGSVFLGIFAGGLALLTAWHLYAGWRARRMTLADAAAGGASASA